MPIIFALISIAAAVLAMAGLVQLVNDKMVASLQWFAASIVMFIIGFMSCTGALN